MCFFTVFVLLSVLSVCMLVEPQSVEYGCWPWNVVVFDLDKDFAQDHKELIQERMRYISDRSCLRFIQTEDLHSEKTPRKYLQIRRGNKCRTIVARMNGSVYITIELESVCTTKRGVLHELVHSLGFEHEHQRVDRKCYVRVFWKKVRQVEAFTVDFQNPNNDWLQRFPYDKSSIMHYSRSSKMKSRDERWFEWEPLGNTEGYLTTWDVWKINYKHCAWKHYCDIYPQHCAIMEEKEKSMDCRN